MGGVVYAADPPTERKIVALDAMDVLYHRLSGTTHIVAEPVPEILEALVAGAADAAGILARLSEIHDLEGEEAEAAIAARLAELEAIGLVWRI